MKALTGTYQVELSDGNKIVFGNNYKPWWQHAVEYIFYNCGDRETIKEHGWRYEFVASAVKAVHYSNQPFYDDGGLKWCNLTAYQGVIDAVCAKDKLAPVKVADIVFGNSPGAAITLTKKLKAYA